MCGIIGVTGREQALPKLIEGLRRLEYRGYDSAGVATVTNGQINRLRANGKIANLAALADSEPLGGLAGIGHTRWATHGRPSEKNAHPHSDGRVVLVHNGIIENYIDLRAELEASGRLFSTETDTEVIVHLISTLIDAGKPPREAVVLALRKLQGAFALAIMFAGCDNLIIGARRGCPLAIGYGTKQMFLGSDALALAPFTETVSYLEEDDWVELTPEGAQIFNSENVQVDREVRPIASSGYTSSKGEFAHFMLKEIYEQPSVIGDALASLLNPVQRTVELSWMDLDLSRLSRVTVIACGTSFYAGLIAKNWIEKYAKIPVECDLGSEFRYREIEMEPGGLTIVISQSGETADTLAALRYAKKQGQQILAVVNVEESSIARESDAVLLTHAGPEIGVASTKAFTTQLIALACFAIFIALERKKITVDQASDLCDALVQVPSAVNLVLGKSSSLSEIAKVVAPANDVLYLGRGPSYPVALEGALKLKEISYIHAEGYAAGELKHGPIALVDDEVPVIVIAPSDALFEKTASNIQEVAARGGRIILFADRKGLEKLRDFVEVAFEVPETDAMITPIVYTIPVQLLAYYAAVQRNTDVDQPRNLAKSVTVE